jgi:hypothetical protein
VKLPSKNQWITLGRYAATYSSGFVTCAVAAHIADPDQGKTALDAIQQIASGVASIYAGATTLVGFAASVWGFVSAGIKSQVASVQASPTEQVLTTDPKIAALPGVRLVDKLAA